MFRVVFWAIVLLVIIVLEVLVVVGCSFQSFGSILVALVGFLAVTSPHPR